MSVVGVDGCRSGWLAIRLQHTGKWEVKIHPDIHSLWENCRDAGLIFIDIPIGLPDRNHPVRFCDQEARRLLGQPRGSSVFPSPSRPALRAPKYQNACKLNKQEIGKRLSKQCFQIMKKIREVDGLLQTEAVARRRIFEVHPEVCFWALNGGKPMKHNKKKRAGFRERLALLKRVLPTVREVIADALFEKRRLKASVGKDDILDAIVAAVTALMPVAKLPEKPTRDAFGLPMQMVYPLLEPKTRHGHSRRCKIRRIL